MEIDSLKEQRKKPERRKLANQYDPIYTKQLNQAGLTNSMVDEATLKKVVCEFA